MSHSDLFKIQSLYYPSDLPTSYPALDDYVVAVGHHPKSRNMVFVTDSSAMYGFVTTDLDTLEQINTSVYCKFCDCEKESGAFFDELVPKKPLSLPIRDVQNVVLTKQRDRFVCESCLDLFLAQRGEILADQR